MPGRKTDVNDAQWIPCLHACGLLRASECTGSYGAGLLHYLQSSEFRVQSSENELLEVTASDKMKCRKRGKSYTINVESAAHAAFSRILSVTPEIRSGMIEALRILKVCCKTAVVARRIALQMIQMNIVSAPDELRDQIHLPGGVSCELIPGLVATRCYRLPQYSGYLSYCTEIAGSKIFGAT